jgi:hypothetical protein
MRNRASSEVISTWQQRIEAWQFTDSSFDATLSRWLDMKRNLPDITLQNDVNSIMAKTRVVDITTMVVEK